MVLSGQLEPGGHLRHLGHWLAGLVWLQAGRPGACCDALLILLTLVVLKPKWALCSMAGDDCGDLVGRPEQWDKAFATTLLWWRET